MGYHKIRAISRVAAKFTVTDEDWKKMSENNMAADAKNDVGSKIGCSLCPEPVRHWYV